MTSRQNHTTRLLSCRWIKTTRQCAVKSCKSKDRITICNILTTTKIEHVLKCSSLHLALIVDVINITTKFTDPYHTMLAENAQCARNQWNTQPCYYPSPDHVQAQIKRQHDTDIALTDTDVIYLSCYKIFCKILENPLSLDSILEELIHSLEAEQPTSQPVSIDECVNHSMPDVTLAIAKSLLKNEAVLLSDTHDTLTSSPTELSQHSQTTNTATVSKRVLHKHLISSLEEHLECKTAEQSVSIFLYRKGGDIMKSLSKALATQCRMRLTVDAPTDTNSTPKTDCNNMLHTVCDLVNDRVHSAIDKYYNRTKTVQ